MTSIFVFSACQDTLEEEFQNPQQYVPESDQLASGMFTNALLQYKFYIKDYGEYWWQLGGNGIPSYAQIYVTKKTATGKAKKVYYRANQYKKNRLVDKAIQDYKTVIKIAPDFIDAHYELAAIYFNQKTPELTFVPPHFNMIAKEKVRVIKIKKRRKKTDIPPKKTISSLPKPKSGKVISPS